MSRDKCAIPKIIHAIHIESWESKKESKRVKEQIGINLLGTTPPPETNVLTTPEQQQNV